MSLVSLDKYMINQVRTRLTKRFLKEMHPKGPTLFKHQHTVIYRNKQRLSNWEKLKVKVAQKQ